MTRRKLNIHSWMVAACWLLVNAATAQNRSISLQDGLCNNFVLATALDGQGNLWVGTETGLNCIAGRTVTSYRREQMGSSNDKILSLYYDRHCDRLLIGTEHELLSYDGRTDRFCHPADSNLVTRRGLTCIATDHRQGVWLVFFNGVVQHMDCATGRVTTLPARLPAARRVMDDGRGHLYVGHNKEGLSIVNLQNPRDVKHYRHNNDDPASLPGNNVRCLLNDSRGRVWVGTDRGLALFDAAAGSFTTVRHTAGGSLPDNVYDVKEMAGGQLWVASDVGGISVVTPSATVPVGGYTYNDDVAITVSSLNTRTILQDGYQNVWVGNHSTGLDFIPARRPFLSWLDYTDERGRPRHVYGIAGDSQGRLWVSSEDELSLWARRPGPDRALHLQGRWHVGAMKHRAHSFARCLMADSQGCLWMGMEDEGVIRFDTRTQRFEPIDIGYDVCDIHSFYEDGDGAVWIGAEHGVCRYYQGRVSHATMIDSLAEWAPVTSFLRLSTGELLLTTQGSGIVAVNTTTMKARRLMMADGLPSNNINQALADRRQGLWLATNEGLVRIADPTDLTRFDVYSTSDGLTDRQVWAVRQDRQGRLWGSTYSSLVCLDPATGRFYNYGQQGQLAVNGSIEGAAAVVDGALLAFGSTGGVCYFMPDDTEVQPRVAPVRISLCEAYWPIEGENATRRLVADSNGRITTAYDQNTLRIAYTVDDYAQTDDVEYSYMMIGLSDKWYYNGSDDDVMFRNLRPGYYTFVLRAKLKSQEWDDAVTTRLSLCITPPFWLSWWACLFYVLLVAAAAWWLFRQYRRRLALRASLEMARRESLQKQELNEERLRFFTNITHELRTPLTLILGPLDDLTADPQLPAPYRRKVGLISKSALRLHDLINQILEFRKTETQNRRLTVARGDLGAFVKETVLNFAELNRNPQVQITAEVAGDLPAVYYDSEVITTILTNLLANAMKYTERGLVSVTLRKTPLPGGAGDGLSLSVSDTGYGIPRDALPHIFDRYYQAGSAHQASGTGIGLALVKSLADLHEATLSVDSEVGYGSRFTFTLMAGNTYPNALHKEDKEDDRQSLAGRQADTAASEDEQEPEEQQPLLLIVEDNDDIRQYIADSLGDDYRIVQAANGQEGVDAATHYMPDIIVSDIMMPRMNGIELTRRLKDDIRTSHVPIILLTAKDSDLDKEEGYESGADSYLTKPFTAKLLASRIRNLLASRRRLAELLSAAGSQAVHKDGNAPQQAPPEATGPMATLRQLDREFMEQLNKVIEENIMLADIDMTFLTDKMAMSHSTLYRKVKALTGLTAKEYVRKRRLHHCYLLLQSGNYNVSEAAMMTGFNQMAHFREVFKKEFGLLPSELVKAG